MTLPPLEGLVAIEEPPGDPPRTQVESQEVAEEGSHPSPAWHGYDPRELALRGVAVRQAKREAAKAQAEAEGGSATVRLVRVPVDTGRIMDRLAKDAAGGNVSAARELRAYLSEVPTEEQTEVTDLDRRTRQRVMGLMLAAVQAEDEEPGGLWTWEGERLVRVDGDSVSPGTPHEQGD